MTDVFCVFCGEKIEEGIVVVYDEEPFCSEKCLASEVIGSSRKVTVQEFQTELDGDTNGS